MSFCRTPALSEAWERWGVPGPPSESMSRVLLASWRSTSRSPGRPPCRSISWRAGLSFFVSAPWRCQGRACFWANGRGIEDDCCRLRFSAEKKVVFQKIEGVGAQSIPLHTAIKNGILFRPSQSWAVNCLPGHVVHFGARWSAHRLDSRRRPSARRARIARARCVVFFALNPRNARGFCPQGRQTESERLLS